VNGENFPSVFLSRETVGLGQKRESLPDVALESEVSDAVRTIDLRRPVEPRRNGTAVGSTSCKRRELGEA
jgi:hypothetical protein